MGIISKILNINIRSKFNFDEKELEQNITKHVFLICAPKSGSTWLTKILENILDWPTIKLLPAYGNREQELDLSDLISSKVQGKVFSPHQHLRYSDYTERILSLLDTHIILQVRDVYDTIMSYRDHMNNENVKVPAAFMNNENWELLNEDEKLSFVVDLVVPWYFNFYCGWITSNLYKKGRVKVVTYNDMKNDPLFTVSDILKHIGEPTDKSTIEKIIEQIAAKNTRKNIGIAGRGDSIPESLKKRVVGYTKYYPKINFDLIGISAEEIEKFK